MNSSRPDGLRGRSKPLRWIACVCLALCGAPAFGARHTSAAAQKARAAASQAADAQPNAGQDLLLGPEGARRADALAAYIEGFIAEDNADGDTMLQNYQKVLAIDPGYSELAVKVALELSRRGEVAQGVDVLKDAIKASPTQPLSYLYLSQIYFKYLKKIDIALKYAMQGLDLAPDNFSSYAALYDIYNGNGDQKKAEATLDRASKSPSEDAQFWLQLGRLYEELLLKEDGTAASPDGLNKMNAVFKKALAFARGDLDTKDRVAEFYFNSRQWKEAIPLLKAVIADRAKSGDPSLVTDRKRLAQCYALNGQRAEAIALLQETIKENPLQSDLYESLAIIYEEDGNLEGALANFQQNLLLNPTVWKNYTVVADFQARLKRYDKAIATLAEARAKFPERPELTYQLALALSLMKRHQEAVTKFEEALHEAENYREDMLDRDFYFNYGAAAEQAGLVDKAADLLKKSIDLDPQHAADAYNYLGFMWADRGEHLEEATELIQRAVALDPGNAAYIDSLGWLYYKKGEPEKALPQLLKAARTIQPEDAVVFEHLGDTYMKLGKTAEALNYWQKAAALDHDNKAVAEKIENTRQKMTAHSAATPVKGN